MIGKSLADIDDEAADRRQSFADRYGREGLRYLGMTDEQLQQAALQATLYQQRLRIDDLPSDLPPGKYDATVTSVDIYHDTRTVTTTAQFGTALHEAVESYVDADGITVDVDAEGNHTEREEAEEEEATTTSPLPAPVMPSVSLRAESEERAAARASSYNVLRASEGQDPWVDPPFEADPGPSPLEVCDVCSAARLAEGGVIATSRTPEELHGGCRRPGQCACSCEFARGGRCMNCKRPRPFDSLAGEAPNLECVDRAGCAEAMLDALPEPGAPKSSRKATSASPRAPRPASEPKEPRQKAPKAAGGPCRCGCEEVTGGGSYRPGHDSRHVKNLVAGVRAGGVTLEAAIEQLPSEALRDKLRKQLEK